MRELASGIIFLCFSLFVMWESLILGLGTLHKPGSGFITFYVGSILGVLSLTLIGQVWKVRTLEQAPAAHRARLAMFFIIVYSFVMEPLGFIVSTFFLMAILFHLGEPRRWWALLGMSAVVTILVYFVFGVLLQVHFPRGILGI